MAHRVSGSPCAISRRRVKGPGRESTTARTQAPTSSSLERSSWRTDVSGADRGGVDRLGDDGDPVVLDRQEAAVDRRGVLLAGGRLDADVALDEDAQQRRVAGEDAELALHGAC